MKGEVIKMKKRKIIAKLMVLSMIISNVSGINVQATENINLPNDNIIYNDNFEAENRETFEGDNVNENLISHETVENDDLISNENEIVEDMEEIGEIAEEFNFPNQSFFGKYVKAHIGISPARYRNILEG